MASHVVFIFAVCFVPMVMGKSIANATTQKYEKCLTNLQCRAGTTHRVVLDNTTYCCKEGQKLSITTGLEKVIMRMSQTLSKMFYTSIMKNTLPGYTASDSKDSNSKGQSLDSSESDSGNSFSDSESMESRSTQDFQDILNYMDSRDIWEYLEDIAGIDNDRLNTRGLSDELEAIASRSSNAGEVALDKRAEMGSEGGRDIISEERDFSKTINERDIINEEQGRLTSLKTTRRGSGIDKLIGKRFRAELNVAMNEKRRSGQDAWADAIYYFLKKRYREDDEKTIRRDTDGGNIEKGEAQIPAGIFAGIFKKDTGFNTENEDNRRLSRALDSPNSPNVEARFDRQGDVNDVADLDKRQQNKDAKPVVGTAPNKETGSKVTGAKNTQTAGKIGDPKSNQPNATKPSGGTQTGSLPTTADKKNRYVLCKCLPEK